MARRSIRGQIRRSVKGLKLISLKTLSRTQTDVFLENIFKPKLVPAAAARKLGASPGSLYVSANTKKITKASTFLTKRTYQEATSGITLEQRALAIKAGTRTAGVGHVVSSRNRKTLLTQRSAAFLDLLKEKEPTTAAEVEALRKQSGMSKTQFREWRKTRGKNIGLFEKEKGRYKYTGLPSHEWVFINVDGKVQHATVSGANWEAMQDWRTAQERSNMHETRRNAITRDMVAERLKEWKRLWPHVYDVDGKEIFPAWDLTTIETAERRMGSKALHKYLRELNYSSELFLAAAA
jgi:hypothetical protein